MTVLEIQELCARFTEQGIPRCMHWTGLNLSVEKGEFVAVVGTSGSGKSTLLHMPGRLRPSDQRQGFRIRKGYFFAERRGTDHFQTAKNRFCVPELQSGAGAQRVGEYRASHSARWAVKVTGAYVSRIIETLGLESKLQNLPNNLSGGQQQRVAIARALAAKPAIILADEPTGNLNSRTSQDVMGLLKVTSQKFAQTIVMITHNEEIARKSADRIIRIEDGRILVRG